jgi:hypothetical protein
MNDDDAPFGVTLDDGAGLDSTPSPAIDEPAPKPKPAPPKPRAVVKAEPDNCVMIVMTARGSRLLGPPLVSQSYTFWPGVPTKVCPDDAAVLIGHAKMAESAVTFAASDGTEEPSAAVVADMAKAARRNPIVPNCGCRK